MVPARPYPRNGHAVGDAEIRADIDLYTGGGNRVRLRRRRHSGCAFSFFLHAFTSAGGDSIFGNFSGHADGERRRESRSDVDERGEGVRECVVGEGDGRCGVVEHGDG